MRHWQDLLAPSAAMDTAWTQQPLQPAVGGVEGGSASQGRCLQPDVQKSIPQGSEY